MGTDNLALWNKLKRTDPKATKPFTRSGFKGTQIDPTWRYQMLTEAFGPCGTGWGYDIVDTQVHDGLVFVGARLWYVDDTGQRRESGVQYGGDVLFKHRKEGPPAPNDEAFKMAVTDAVGKASLLLGLAADIYMGQFDDSKYREESEAFYAAKAAEPTEGEKGAAAALKLGFDCCETVEQLEGFWREHKANIADLPKPLKQEVINYAGDRKRFLVTPAHPAE
ncbi:hypothetical protein [Azospirillum himalayense]|uniref:Uncharacterized protein n=1 Tax=Azospirillum himalayense TaxID=654847 RepID=A0ABW0FY19_9PROT